MSPSSSVASSPQAFRDRLHARGESYLLEVMPDTRVWLAASVEQVHGEPLHVLEVAASLAPTRWHRMKVRDREKEPVEVEAARVWVVVPRQQTPQRRVESLLLVRKPDGSKAWQFLSNAPKGCRLAEMVRAASCQHAVEEALEVARGDVGLEEYEVRTDTG